MLKQSSFIFPAIFYLLISPVILFQNRYQLDPDAISYISIARTYLNGDLANAINGYWGPLYSWLLSPLLLLTPPIFAIKILTFISGFLIVISSYLLFEKFFKSKFYLTICLFSIIPFIFYFSTIISSPDLLLTAILIFYTTILVTLKNFDTKNALLLSILGFLAYLTKFYGLTFFILSLVIFFLINLYFKKINLKFLLKIILISSALISLWAIPLSIKYKFFTLGTSASYNLNLSGPTYNFLHPMLTNGLYKPPYQISRSIWEDPYLLNIDSWYPLSSKESFIYQINNMKTNTHKIKNIFLNYSPIFITVPFIFIIFFSKSKNLDPKLIYILILSFIYPTGYLITIIEERYLIYPLILFIFLLFYFLEKTFPKKTLLSIFLLCALIFYPLNFIFSTQENGQELHNLSKEIKSLNITQKNIASNINWNQTLILIELTDNFYLGQLRKDSTINQLKMYNIDYYFHWGVKISDVNLQEIKSFNKLTIYKVN